jgi:putative DNA methylase
MTPRKKLIEVALPLEAINEASVQEGFIYKGNPSAIHKWWAQRPLAAARAVIFSSLVDDPNDADALPAFVQACSELPKPPNFAPDQQPTPRDRLFFFIERLVQWDSASDEAMLTAARELIQIATEGNPPPLLDPFAGGGSIPLEAQRLGLESYASDLNPVAVMINKAQTEIPPRVANMPPINPHDRAKVGSMSGWKGAAGLAADIRYFGEKLRQKAWNRIGEFYPNHNNEPVIGWIWARTVKCPNPACGAQMPLISSLDLSTRKGSLAWLEPIVDKVAKKVTFTVKRDGNRGKDSVKIGRGAKFRCLVCEEIAPEQHNSI